MFIYSSDILGFIDEIMNNTVAVIILSLIFGGLYFLLDFLSRKKFKEEDKVGIVLGEIKRSDLLGVELCIISPGIP